MLTPAFGAVMGVGGVLLRFGRSLWVVVLRVGEVVVVVVGLCLFVVLVLVGGIAVGMVRVLTWLCTLLVVLKVVV